MINSRTINRRASPTSRFIPRDQEEFFINRRPSNQSNNRRSPVVPLNNLRKSPVQQGQFRSPPRSFSRSSPSQRFSRMNLNDGFEGTETDDEEHESAELEKELSQKKKSKKSTSKIQKKPNSWIITLAYIVNAAAAQCGRPVRIDEVIDIVGDNYPGKRPKKKPFDINKHRSEAEERRKQLEKIDRETGSEYLERADKSIREIMNMLNSNGTCRR